MMFGCLCVWEASVWGGGGAAGVPSGVTREESFQLFLACNKCWGYILDVNLFTFGKVKF